MNLVFENIDNAIVAKVRKAVNDIVTNFNGITDIMDIVKVVNTANNMWIFSKSQLETWERVLDRAAKKVYDASDEVYVRQSYEKAKMKIKTELIGRDNQ
ncbi:MAG: hypothetical protein J5993_06260 [Clostridia bacterium]|nr:hypothetical protein [Clostridia bacterium]